MSTAVLITGGFDPLHSGHIEYIKSAKSLGDVLVVGLNSDDWLKRKKGQACLPLKDRKAVVENLEGVDMVITFNDKDDTAIDAISQVFPNFTKTIFANGGDRSSAASTPEYAKYKNHKKVDFAFGVGGSDKKNSSSSIISNWVIPTVQRDWGEWKVFEEQNGYKVKQLTIEPDKSLSVQRHFHRDEYWYVLNGYVDVELEDEVVSLGRGDTLLICKKEWHCAYNPHPTENAVILEVQSGDSCNEDDIERRT